MRDDGDVAGRGDHVLGDGHRARGRDVNRAAGDHARVVVVVDAADGEATEVGNPGVAGGRLRFEAADGGYDLLGERADVLARHQVGLAHRHGVRIGAADDIGAAIGAAVLDRTCRDGDESRGASGTDLRQQQVADDLGDVEVVVGAAIGEGRQRAALGVDVDIVAGRADRGPGPQGDRVRGDVDAGPARTGRAARVGDDSRQPVGGIDQIDGVDDRSLGTEAHIAAGDDVADVEVALGLADKDVVGGGGGQGGIPPVIVGQGAEEVDADIVVGLADRHIGPEHDDSGADVGEIGVQRIGDRPTYGVELNLA